MLFLFVEGSDDKRFFESYYKNQDIKIILYATETNKSIYGYIKSIEKLHNSDYLFFADADGTTIDAKTEIIHKKYPMCDKSKIRIVQREIESWYLAGVNLSSCNKYKIKYFPRTDDISKEKFDSILPKNQTHISFQQEILKNFDKDCAKSRNYSFDSFAS